MTDESTAIDMADLANEYLDRLRAGEFPSIAEYEKRYPEHAEEIRSMFPMMLLMEESAHKPEDEYSLGLRQLGDFRILREIGRGGMGVVYEARQESLGRLVALKVLPIKSQLSTRNRERFRRESRAAAMLHHSNIVPVFAVGEEGDFLYYAMQYIAGAPLDDVIIELKKMESAEPDSFTRLTNVEFSCHSNLVSHADVLASTVESLASNTAGSDSVESGFGSGVSYASLPGQSRSDSESGKATCYWNSVASLGVQVADAMAYAHDHGTLHRDIKPGNLMLDESGTVWVLDFGLAKSSAEDGLTRAGEMIGTLRYMSPEQCKGNSDKRSDIYGLGATLYEMLTLRPAFTEESRHELLRAIVEKEPTRPRKINPRVPRDLETIVLKAMNPAPAMRYESAVSLKNDLQRFLNGEPIEARAVSSIERVRKWAKRRPAIASLIAALATLFVVSFGLITWKWLDAEHSSSIAVTGELKANAAAKSERAARLVAASNLELAEDLLYSSQISRVLATATTNPGPARMALNSLIPKAGQKDRRDWEWGYLNTLINQEVACFECGAYQAEFIWDLAFSHDDSLLAVCAGRTRFSLPSDGSSPKGRVTIWDTRSNELVCELPIERSGYAASFSHDGKRLVVSEPFTPSLWETRFHGPVQVWDIASRKPIVSLAMPKDHRANLLHFSNDDKFVYGTIWPQSGQGYAYPTAVVVWDAKTGDEIRRVTKAEFVETTDELNVAVLKLFREGGWRPDVVRYDLDADKILSTLPHRSVSTDIVSAEMQLSAHVMLEGLLLTDLESGETENLVGHDGHRPQNRFSSRGVLDFHPTKPEMYVGATDGTVRVWSTHTRNPGKTLRGHNAPVNDVAISHQGHMLASGDWNGQVRIWQPTFSSHLKKLYPRSERFLRPRFEAVGFRWGGAGVVAYEPGRLQTFASESGQLLDEQYIPGQTVLDFRTAAFDFQGNWLGLVSSKDISIYDVESGKVVCKTDSNVKAAHSICFAKSKSRFAYANGQKRNEPSSACVYEIVDGKPEAVSVFEHDAREFSIDSVALDETGDRIAIAGRELGADAEPILKVVVIDIATDQQITLPGIANIDSDGRMSYVPSVVFSPDGKKLAACTRHGYFCIYDLESKTKIAEDKNAPEALEDVSWNPAGTRIAGVNRETMVLWNPQGRVVLQMPREHRLGDLPFDPEVRFSPDGKRIAANMWDHTVKLWTSRINIDGDAEPDSKRSSSLAVDSIEAAVSAHDNPWYLAHRGYLKSVDGNLAEAAADYVEAKKRLAGDEPCMLFAGPAYVTAPTIPFHELESVTVEYWVKDWNNVAGAFDSRDVGQVVSQYPVPDRFGVRPKLYKSRAFYDKLPLRGKHSDSEQWVHVMVTQDQKFRRHFINGKLIRNRKAIPFAPNSERFHIADTIFHDVNSKGRGLMRSVHVSRGVLRTENFTPQETIEANDGSILLYEFTKDNTLEGAVIKDRSNNGNDGILHQAWWQD